MSTSRSSSRVSRHQPGRSVSYVESALPDGPVDEETVQLLNELVHPHHEQDNTLVDDIEDDLEPDLERQQLPWWRRPSPLWLLVFTPVSTMVASATLAPKVEIYTLLACSVHKPEIFKDRHFLPAPSFQSSAETIKTTFPLSFDIATNTSSPAVIPLADYPTQECNSDPVVRAAVAKLTATLTTSMGVLGMLTTGWWGAFSDRAGRTRVLGLTVFGLLLNDMNFIFVTKNFQRIPGGYWFLIVGPLIEGALGGIGAGSAASHAYISDTTHPSERSRYFSSLLGLVFCGFSAGPVIGGLLVRYEGLLSVFYLATVIHGLFSLLSFIVLPESLTKRKMQAASALYHESLRVLDEQEKTVLLRLQRLFAFLKPLTIFFPASIETGSKRLSSNKGRKWDWNLTLLAMAYGFTISIMGSLSFKLQYILAYFNWTSENVGYFLTVTGATRAAFLAVILPVTIKIVRSVFQRSRRASELDPLLAPSSPEPHSAAFDLALARISLFIEVIAYTAMPFATSGLAFTGFTILSSFGSGFNPAVQSAAMELYSKRIGTSVEAGKLFGGMSVIQALSGQVLGPSIYGLVFVKTVGTFDTAIFFVSVLSVCISFLCLTLVRLPTDIKTDAEEEEAVPFIPDHPGRDATLVDIDAGDSRTGRRKVASLVVPTVTVSAPTP
ncbi:MFS domain-containing protein [Mycena sanguinolenta]|uniref:MFS domain-containing protein n=1 Tax=Mycena sanguinolenta TaxID=230812 RepID=A0A8H7D8P1_9AGAR|nr:MFS domain-containing protein [Mycena sanguinolenta]